MPRKLNLEHIAKIEGHAKLYVKVADGKVEKAELRVMEGARFFQGILKDRRFNDLAHISSRICGVCSVAHTLTSTRAVENAFGIKVSDQTEQLREVLTIGGIIQSHVLHLYFLTLPDYAGAESAIALAKTNRPTIERALKLKRLGNHIVFAIAGRDVHPIACMPGGFSRTPEQSRIDELLEELKSCKQDAVETVKLFMALTYPEFSVAAPHFTLTGQTYFNSQDMIKCEKEARFPTKDYQEHFKEHLRKGAPTEFATQEGKSYFVGAVARMCNNFDMLTSEAKRYARKVCDNKDNPFMNIPAQAIEILEGINRCIIILSNLKLQQEALSEEAIKPKACRGVAASEAPRGTVFHDYEFDDKGYCRIADIITPTSQNLQHIEQAIKEYLSTMLDKSPDQVRHEIEKLIRAYDPCISCSTHFLDIEWEVE
jgi:coenzyme F420-reducing hydrogenase alpha subunit